MRIMFVLFFLKYELLQFVFIGLILSMQKARELSIIYTLNSLNLGFR